MSTIFAVNKKLGLQFPVHAIVSDLSQFFYYCYTGDEFISLGSFDLATTVRFDIKTANNLTTTFMLSSFASDFFSILLEGGSIAIQSLQQSIYSLRVVPHL